MNLGNMINSCFIFPLTLCIKVNWYLYFQLCYFLISKWFNIIISFYKIFWKWLQDKMVSKDFIFKGLLYDDLYHSPYLEKNHVECMPTAFACSFCLCLNIIFLMEFLNFCRIAMFLRIWHVFVLFMILI